MIKEEYEGPFDPPDPNAGINKRNIKHHDSEIIKNEVSILSG